MAANPVELPLLHLHAATANGRTIVKCQGSLVHTTIDTFREETKRLIERSRWLVVDLADLTYMDSSGLGALVGAYSTARRANCEFSLLHLTPRVTYLLSITKLTSILQETPENLL